MKKTRTAVVNRIRDLEAESPPVSPVEALRRNLLYTMLNSVSEQDVEDIVTKQAGKAKAGDTPAARLIISMIQAGSDRSTHTHMQQAIVSRQETDTRFLSDTREQLARIIGTTGPQQSAHLAGLMHAPLTHVLEALNDHAWFEKEADGWHVTNDARRDVLGMPKED